MTASSTWSLERVAPWVFAGVGVLLVMLACYMAGADSLACGRNGDRVDCRVSRSRLLGSVTVEQFVVSDVIDAWVTTSTTSKQTYRSGRGSNAEHTSSNDTLILHTRDDRDVATLGGDQSASYADQVVAIVKATRRAGRGRSRPRRSQRQGRAHELRSARQLRSDRACLRRAGRSFRDLRDRGDDSAIANATSA